MSALVLLYVFLLGAPTVWALNPDSITITINISTRLSVNIENSNFTTSASQNLGDAFTLAQTEVLSIDNNSGTTAYGIRESYQLSASLSSPSGWQATSLTDGAAGVDDLAILAVFSSAASLQPASGEFDTSADFLTTTPQTATSTLFYGTGSSTGKSGVQVTPAAGSERNLWLRFLLPTSSSSEATSTVLIVYVNAIAA